jgi:hypothetical protein
MGTSFAAQLAGLQRMAGNRAVGGLLRVSPPAVQRCGCGGLSPTTDEQDLSVQRFGFGFLDELVTAAGELFGGGDAEPLDQQAPAICSEKPNWQPEQSIPVDIRADTALDFVSQMKTALGGHPHMQPSFTWAPEADEKDRVTKVNLKITTKIVRPRFAGGRPSAAERKLIDKVEGLIMAHEERHREIAKTFAQKAVCAAIGKSSAGNPAPYEQAIKAVMCDMNKAQEALDRKEGTLSWTLDDGGTRVVDVNLAPEPSASYPC